MTQAAVTDSVFQNLPDTLIAPADGPTPALIADYLFGYEAGDYFDGDFYLGDTTSMFDLGPAAVLEVPLESYTGSVPSFLPDGLGIGGNVPYGSESHPSGYVWFNDWGAAINDVMPWGYVGGGQGEITIDDTTGADEILGGGIAPGGVTTFMYLVDKVRPGLPLTAIYQTATHDTAAQTSLLDPVQTPSATGLGGYSQSPVPTTLTATDLSSTGAPTKNPASVALSAPTKAETPASPESETPPAETSDPGWMTSAAQTGSATGAASAASGGTIVVAVLVAEPDANAEPAELDDRAEGEPTSDSGQTQQQLGSAGKTAQSTPVQVFQLPSAGDSETGGDSSPAAGDGGANPGTSESPGGDAATDSQPGVTIGIAFEEAPRDPQASTASLLKTWGEQMMNSEDPADWSAEADAMLARWAAEGMPIADEMAAQFKNWIANRRNISLGIRGASLDIEEHRDDGDPTWGEAAANRAISTAGIGGTLIVVGIIFPPAGLIGGTILLGVGVGESIGSRAAAGQDIVQIGIGVVGDVSGAGGIYTGLTGKDFGSFEDLHLAEWQKGEAFGGGSVQFATIAVPAGIKGGRYLAKNYEITFDQATLSMNGLGGVKISPINSAKAQPLTNAQLVQEIAIRAESRVGGTGRLPGIDKHTYAKRLLDRYQKMFGQRGLETEKSWINGNRTSYGKKDSIRVDVLDRPASTVYDYKFVAVPPGLTSSRAAQIRANVPGILIVVEVNP